MNKMEFFQQAALAICGKLEIEAALHAFFNILVKQMPVTKLFLQRFDTEYNCMRTIAYSSAIEYGKMDLLTPLSQDARKLVMENMESVQGIYLFNAPHISPITIEMLNYHSITASSLIVMDLQTENKLLGNFVLISENDTLSEEYKDMVYSIKEPLAIAMSNALKHQEMIKLQNLTADDNRYLHGELRRLSGDEIVGSNFGLKDVVTKVRKVAALDSPVLILGETGVGKDVIANTIHYSSMRNKGPFVSVNCGAIPDTLIDSELFGHEKGAFTGALVQKRGRFERANKGTIFLDEIGELPLAAQVRLLKVLQSKEIERVGGVSTIKLDIRVIAATNRNLEEMIKKRQFREDLWFRLNVFPIWIPPLRERKVDIPALIQHFTGLKSKELKLAKIPTLAPGSTELLMEYQWPGNVRELQNVIERSMILSPQGPLTFEHLTQKPDQQVQRGKTDLPESENLDDMISIHIRRVLSKTNGKVSGKGGAAARLGVNPSTLRNRIKKLGIKYKQKQDYF